MRILDCWSLAFLTACAGLGAPSSSSTSSTEPRASGADSSGSVTIPDVVMLPRDQAIATLRRAGVQGDITDDGNLCGSIVNGLIVETGQVCSRARRAATTYLKVIRSKAGSRWSTT